MQLYLEINGERQSFEIEAGESLLSALRREGFFGVKRGCEEGYCGACTVLLDGLPVKSCLLFAAKAEGKKITTIEGLGTPNLPHILQETFARVAAVQCGFCSPGFILTAFALLKENPRPTDQEIKIALDGNYCRCTGYVKPLLAVKEAAKIMRGEK